MTSEQQQTVNIGHFLGVPRVVVVHKFDFTNPASLKFNYIKFLSKLKDLSLHFCFGFVSEKEEIFVNYWNSIRDNQIQKAFRVTKFLSHWLKCQKFLLETVKLSGGSRVDQKLAIFFYQIEQVNSKLFPRGANQDILRTINGPLTGLKKNYGINVITLVNKN